MSTVVAEQYGPTPSSGPRLYVVSGTPDVSGDMALFASGRATLVLPERAPAPDADVSVLRAGTGPYVDLAQLVDLIAGTERTAAARVPRRAASDYVVLLAEGGPTLAGAMVSQALIDEFFLTLAPRVIAGGSTRVIHGNNADPAPWD